MSLIGGNPAGKVTGLDELPGKSNYLIGNDPKGWRTNVPNFAWVKYQNVYPGVDLVYYGNQRQLEFDWVVKPGADPKTIRLALKTGKWKSEIGNSILQNRVSVDAKGDLVIDTGGGEVVFKKPLIYQEPSTDDSSHLTAQNENRISKFETRHFIKGRYVLHVSKPKSKIGVRKYEVTFQVASYDHSKPLIIDPTLIYSNYLGGTNDDQGFGIAVDSSGSAYITGFTDSLNFPTTVGALNRTADLGACTVGPCMGDAFVTKLDPTGTNLVYSTYLGGSNTDVGNAIAVDTAGNAYVAGYTLSPDFPAATSITGGTPFQTSIDLGSCSVGSVCANDAFVAKLDSTGAKLIYSTFLGGSGVDIAKGIAVDSAPTPNIYVTGSSGSTDFPTSTNAFQTQCVSCQIGSGAFIAELAPAGTGSSDLIYSSYLGPSVVTGNAFGQGIAVDPSSGGIYVVGASAGTGFPTTTGAFQTANNGGGYDAFVAKSNPAASTGLLSLPYSTLLGGSGSDLGFAITVDPAGNAFVTGSTTSSSSATIPFPTKNALQPSMVGAQNAFIAEINPAGGGASDLIFSTYLGGSQSDVGYGIALDTSGNIYATGQTTSADFPTVNPFQAVADNGNCLNPGTACNGDAFVTEIDPTGSAIIFSTFHGGSSADSGQAIAVDRASPANVFVTGQTQSTDFPHTNGAFQTTNDGGLDAFVSKFSNLPVASVAPPTLTFAAQLVGTTSAAQAVTLSNTGTGPLSIASIVPSGDFALATTSTSCPYGGGTVNPGATCTIDVTFTPTTAGARKGSIAVSDNAGNSPQTIALSGVGINIQLRVSPAALALPGTHINQTCTPGTVTVANLGAIALTISSVSSNVPFFVVTANNCPLSPATLAARASCTVSVTYVPTAVATQTGTLTITSNAANSPDTVALKAVGLPSCFLASNVPAAAIMRGSDSTTFTIAHQACSAAGPVHLTCSNQSPATCAFSPDTLTSPDTASTLTVSNLQALTGDLKFQVHADATLEHLNTGLSVDLMDFLMASAAASGTINAGQTASYAVAVASTHGLQGMVSFTCNGAPTGATCTVTPQAVTLNATGSSNVTVKVSTTARSTVGPPATRRMLPPGAGPLGLIMLGLMALLTGRLARMKTRALAPARLRLATLAAGLVVAMVLTWAACGGTTVSPVSSNPFVTPAGTYTLTVTGTYTASETTAQLVHNTTLTLTVH